MKYAVRLLVGGVAIAATGLAPAMAADIYEQPTIIEAPAYAAPEYVPAAVTGWYLRGDIGYAINNFRGAEYYTFGCGVGCPGIIAGSNTLSGDLKGSFGYGVGAGYQMNHYLRGDVTLDYFTTDFTGRTRGACGVAVDCISTDIASATALALMANVYVDFGTYGRFTPYAGVGIGGVQLNWGDLSNTACDATNPALCDPTVVHRGHVDWRFAYAVMAGVSVDVTCNLAADVGYRYRRIENGSMLSYAAGTGPAFDRGIDSHEFRTGVRFKLGGCEKPVAVAYEPTPLPVFK